MCRPSLRNSLHCENKDLLALLCSSQVWTCQGFVKVKGIHILNEVMYSGNKIRKAQNDNRLSKFERCVIVNVIQISCLEIWSLLSYLITTVTGVNLQTQSLGCST